MGAGAGLDVVDVRRPLGDPAEPYAWVSETSVAPWSIYVLQAATSRPNPPSGERAEPRD